MMVACTIKGRTRLYIYYKLVGSTSASIERAYRQSLLCLSLSLDETHYIRIKFITRKRTPYKAPRGQWTLFAQHSLCHGKHLPLNDKRSSVYDYTNKLVSLCHLGKQPDIDIAPLSAANLNKKHNTLPKLQTVVCEHMIVCLPKWHRLTCRCRKCKVVCKKLS